MIIYLYIAYISIIIWLLPPIKQYKTEYFFFFLVLALSDVITLVFSLLFHLNTQIMYAFSTAFLIVSLVRLDKIKIALLFIATGLLTILCWIYNSKLLFVLYAMFSFIILLIITFQFLQNLILKNSISIFFVFLIAYEFSLLLKNIVIVTNIIQGLTLFFVTTTFEIVFGIIFTFVNINTKVYKLPVKDIE